MFEYNGYTCDFALFCFDDSPRTSSVPRVATKKNAPVSANSAAAAMSPFISQIFMSRLQTRAGVELAARLSPWKYKYAVARLLFTVKASPSIDLHQIRFVRRCRGRLNQAAAAGMNITC